MSCPFTETDTRCGARTAAYHEDDQLVVCENGHISSVSSLTAPPTEAPSLKPKPRWWLYVTPKDAALATVLAALVLNAILEHL